jgi:hypothetical protein
MMKNVKYITRMLAPIALLCGSAVAAADPGFYIGFSLGEANYDVEPGTSGVFPIVSSSYSDDTGTAVAVTGGYRFSSHLALEASYMDLGTFKYSESGRRTAPVSSGTLDADVSASGIALLLAVSAPIGNWDIHAKFGGMQTKTDSTVVVRSQSLVQQNASESATTFETVVGLGVGYTIAEHYNLALDWTGVKEVGDDDTGEADVNVVSLGFSYRF